MERIKNLQTLTLSEVLQKINDNPTLMSPGQPFAFVHGSALHQIFSFAFHPKMKFLLPEGDPPFTPSTQRVGMQSIDLLIAIKKKQLLLFIDPSIKQITREKLFINLLETVYADEAKVLLAIKDQNLTSLYPNLTYTLLKQYGYLPTIDKWENEMKSPKSEDLETVAPLSEQDDNDVTQESQVQQDQPVEVKRGRGRPRKTEASI